MNRVLKRLRGAVGNAMVWGMSWFGGALLWLTTLKLTGQVPVHATWSFILLIATNIGVTGLLTGGAFSAFLGIHYSDRPLLGIRPSRLLLAGAAIGAACSPVVTLFARYWGFGMGLPGDLLTGALIATVFGAVTSGATIGLAQGASRQVTDGATDQLEIEQRAVVALLEEETV